MNRWKIIIAVGLIVTGTAYLMVSSAASEGIVYRTVQQVRSGNFERARLTGHVAAGSIQRQAAERRLRFQLLDRDSGLIEVTYTGTVPDTLRDGSEAVVSGHYDSAADVFVANDVLAKCPSKYEGKYDTHVRAVGGVASNASPAETTGWVPAERTY